MVLLPGGVQQVEHTLDTGGRGTLAEEGEHKEIGRKTKKHCTRVSARSRRMELISSGNESFREGPWMCDKLRGRSGLRIAQNEAEQPKQHRVRLPTRKLNFCIESLVSGQSLQGGRWEQPDDRKSFRTAVTFSQSLHLRRRSRILRMAKIATRAAPILGPESGTGRVSKGWILIVPGTPLCLLTMTPGTPLLF